jgi:hypothetical protein
MKHGPLCIVNRESVIVLAETDKNANQSLFRESIRWAEAALHFNDLLAYAHRWAGGKTRLHILRGSEMVGESVSLEGLCDCIVVLVHEGEERIRCSCADAVFTSIEVESGVDEDRLSRHAAMSRASKANGPEL